jgi:hypothetical protein
MSRRAALVHLRSRAVVVGMSGPLYNAMQGWSPLCESGLAVVARVRGLCTVLRLVSDQTGRQRGGASLCSVHDVIGKRRGRRSLCRSCRAALIERATGFMRRCCAFLPR